MSDPNSASSELTPNQIRKRADGTKYFPNESPSNGVAARGLAVCRYEHAKINKRFLEFDPIDSDIASLDAFSAIPSLDSVAVGSFSVSAVVERKR